MHMALLCEMFFAHCWIMLRAAVLVFLSVACGMYIQLSPLNNTDFDGKGVNILLPQTEHAIPHCSIVTSKPTQHLEA